MKASALRSGVSAAWWCACAGRKDTDYSVDNEPELSKIYKLGPNWSHDQLARFNIGGGTWRCPSSRSSSSGAGWDSLETGPVLASLFMPAAVTFRPRGSPRHGADVASCRRPISGGVASKGRARAGPEVPPGRSRWLLALDARQRGAGVRTDGDVDVDHVHVLDHEPSVADLQGCLLRRLCLRSGSAAQQRHLLLDVKAAQLRLQLLLVGRLTSRWTTSSCPKNTRTPRP